jgi:hypothetical protein
VIGLVWQRLKEHVRGFQIAVDDALAVGEGEPAQNLALDVERPRRRQGPAEGAASLAEADIAGGSPVGCSRVRALNLLNLVHAAPERPRCSSMADMRSRVS